MEWPPALDTSLTGREHASYNKRSTTREEHRLEPVEYARKAVEVASEKQATDILLLDIRRVSSFADFFVIMTAESRRQMEALSEDVETALKQTGASFHHREGGVNAGWLLLDFGDVIVHVFAPEEREFYRLEERWARGRELVRVQ